MKIRSINKWIAASLFFIILALNASAQELITVKGTVYSADAKKLCLTYRFTPCMPKER